MSTSMINVTVKQDVPDQTKGRAKDQAWTHVSVCEGHMGKRILVCNFCDKAFGGGGINRFKKHLAGIKGEGGECEHVDPDVKEAIQASLKDDKHTKNDDEEQMRIKGQRGLTKDEGLTRDELRAIIAEEVVKAIQATVPPLLEQHMEETCKRIEERQVNKEVDVAEEVVKAIQATVPPLLEQHMEETCKRIEERQVNKEVDVAVTKKKPGRPKKVNKKNENNG